MVNSFYADPALGGNGTTTDDSASPTTGLDNGGHVTRLVPMFSQMTAMLTYTKNAIASSASSAATDADDAATSASNAAATLAQVQNVANGVSFSSTSITSVAIGLGSKTFTVQANESYVYGMPIYIVDAGNPANFMIGLCTNYSGTTLIVLVSQIGGSGTIANWSISIGGIPGATGATGATGAAGATFTGGSLTSALNVAKATVASHATTADIWGAAGNLIDFTGTATVTAFPAAPQAGAERRLLCAAACSFTNSANLIVQGGANHTAAAGDIVTVTAITTTQSRLTIEKASGAAVAGGSGQIGDVIISAQAPADTNYKEAGLVYTQATYPAAYALLGRQMNNTANVPGSGTHYVGAGQTRKCIAGGGYGFWLRYGNNYGYVVPDGGSGRSATADVGGTGNLQQIVGGTSTMALMVLQSGHGYGIDPASPSTLAQTPAQVATFNAEGGFYAFGKFWMFGYDTGTNNLKVVSNNATLTGSWTTATITNNVASTTYGEGCFVVTGASSAILYGSSYSMTTTNSGATWDRTYGIYAGASNGVTLFQPTTVRYFTICSATHPVNNGNIFLWNTDSLIGSSHKMSQYVMGHYWSLWAKTDGTAFITRVNATDPMDQSCYPIILDDSTAWSSAPMLNAGGDRLFWSQSSGSVSEMKLANYTWATQFYVPAPGSPPPGFKTYVKLL